VLLVQRKNEITVYVGSAYNYFGS